MRITLNILKIAYSFKCVYTQPIPKQNRVKIMSIRKEVKMTVNLELNEVKIEGLATYPIHDMSNICDIDATGRDVGSN